MEGHKSFLFEKLASWSFENTTKLSLENVLRIYSADLPVPYRNNVLKRQR